MTTTFIPAVKSFVSHPGRFRLGPVVEITVWPDPGAAGTVPDWLVERLSREVGVRATVTNAENPLIRLHLLKADEEFRSAGCSSVFATALGREQGYILDVSQQCTTISALSTHGLQNGVATLLQLFRRPESGSGLHCCHIEDWPDIRFRAADWLLNAEINRWGYERGDGLETTVARFRRKLEQAAAYKINVIWFDGFGWDPDRTAWYADVVRELSEYARRLHIRLAHGGYGGGYGASYQVSSIYFGRYQGRVFRNRYSYPDGDIYDCAGHPDYPTSWSHGTCLSNDRLASLKLAELTRFVQRCQPGMLYIHDIDTGDIVRSAAGWQHRCAQCRERWPDAEMASPNGAAGGYAHWFRKVVDAINAVVSDDGEYAAARDCEIVFVGPAYSECHDSDERWLAYCDYARIMSRCLEPAANVEFGVREQFVSDTPSGLRIRQLVDALDAAGCGHGVFVVPFVGGDNYYNDQLVSTAAALHSYWQGARTVYISSLGSVGEPGQVLCANYAWHTSAPGAYRPTPTRQEALDLRRRCVTGVETQDAVIGPDGVLGDACNWLYGAAAGPLMAELFALGSGRGLFPVATGWRRAADEVSVLERGSSDEEAVRIEYWLHREKLTSMALDLIGKVMEQKLPNVDVRQDLAWLAMGLEIGLRLCRTFGGYWQWKMTADEAVRERLNDNVADLQKYVAAQLPEKTVDPVGGDILVWRMIVTKLEKLLSTETQNDLPERAGSEV